MKLTRNHIFTFICLAILSASVGCTPSHTYDVSLLNASHSTITLWLTKDGGPLQDGWLSPEDLARMPREDVHYDLANIVPGKTGYTGEVPGTLDKGVHAILRVYPGNFDLTDILRDKPVPTSYVLSPGKNDLIAVDEGNKLIIKPADPPTASNPASK